MTKDHNVTTENWTCTNCGGTLKWNIPKQQFECSSCRTPREIESELEAVEEHDFDSYLAIECEEVAFPEEVMIICQTCGAEIAFCTAETAKTCPMCGSTHVAAEKQVAGVPPDGVIPFAISKEQAQEYFHQWVKSRWFAPNKLKKAYQQGRLDGIYIPYWTFDAQVNAHYEGRGGTYHTYTDSKGEKQTKTKWKNVSGDVKGSFDDLAVCASLHKIAEVMEDILPFSTQDKSVPYASAYLSGFGAERYAIPATEAVTTAKTKMKSEMKSTAESSIKIKLGYDVSEVQKVQMSYQELQYKQILVPVWASAFSYSNKQYLYLINGENGVVGGQRPYSVPKIITAIIVMLMLIFFAFSIFSTDSEAKELTYVPTPAVHESITAEEL